MPTEPEQIALTIGSSKTIQLNTLEEVHLSRRGLIDLSFLGNKKWRLTGHKEGFVILSYMELNNEHEQQLFITVKKSLSKKHHLFPPWLCDQENVSCHHQKQTLEGHLKDPQLFYAAKKLCQKLKTCFFKLKLTAQGIKVLTQQIKTIFPSSSQLHINHNGLIQINITCHNDETANNKRLRFLKKMSEQLNLSENIVITCQHLHNPKSFKLKIKVFLMETATAKKIGFDSSISGQLALTHPLNNLSFNTQLSPHMSKHQLQIIGEPILTMMNGIPAHIQSGGEIPFIQTKKDRYHHLQQVNAWKEYGLDLKLTLYQQSKAKALLDYQLVLKTPSKDNTQQNMHSQRLQSMLELTVGQASIAGGIHYLSHTKKEKTIPFLNKIPIIAPLCRLFLMEKTKMSLFVLFELLPS